MSNAEETATCVGRCIKIKADANEQVEALLDVTVGGDCVVNRDTINHI